MNLPYQRGTQFNDDFDAQYRWYFEHADETVAGRFLEAVEESLSLLATQPESEYGGDFAILNLSDFVRFARSRRLTEFKYFTVLQTNRYRPGDSCMVRAICRAD